MTYQKQLMEYLKKMASEVGKRIVQIRTSLGFKKQVEFSDFLGIKQATLSAMETGDNDPSLASVRIILQKVRNLNPFWLLNGEGQMFLKEGETPIKQQIQPKTYNQEEFISHLKEEIEFYRNLLKEKQTGSKTGLVV